jgi:hypothetical protein
MTKRASTAAALLALAVTGCATEHEDYGEMRRSRFDHPYLGGAGSVPPPRPLEESPKLSTAEALGAFVYLSAFVLAWTGHAELHVTSAPREPPPPPPPPSGH